jgi:hypothetical protein
MWFRDVSGNDDASVEDEKTAYSPDGQSGGALLCNRSVTSFRLTKPGVSLLDLPPDEREKHVLQMPMPKLRLPQSFLVGREEYTVAMWVRDSGRPTAPSGKSVRMLFQEGFPKGADAVYPLSVNFVEQRLRAFCLGELVDPVQPSAEAMTPEDSIPKDQWFFLALTLVKEGAVLKITVDDQAYQQPFASLPGNAQGGFGMAGGIDGLIDELAFFGRALTDEETSRLRERGRAGKPLIASEMAAAGDTR